MLDNSHVAVRGPMPRGSGGSHDTDQMMIAQNGGRLDVRQAVEERRQSWSYFPCPPHISVANHMIRVDAMVLWSDAGDERSVVGIGARSHYRYSGAGGGSVRIGPSPEVGGESWR